MALVPQYLRADEEAQIHRHFQGDTWRRNNQVLWSGILRDEAQRWADEHEMQTLTTAMGPLMDLSHPLCLRNQKSSDAWSKYVKGASALFAWYISRGERVTVLSPPPPERFHPSGQPNYQVIEEPIVKGILGTSAVSRIEMVHPTVKGAENISYQIWPVDDTTTWTTRFGELNVQKRRWRMVKTVKTVKTVKAFSNKLGGMEIAKEEAKEKGKAKKEKKKKKARNAKKEEKAKAKEEKSKKEKGKEKAKAKVKAKEEEKSKEKEKKKTRKAKKERKKARKAKKEKKLAKKKAKKLEKEEKASNQGRPEAIEDDDGWLV